jgi:hypothetical protein
MRKRFLLFFVLLICNRCSETTIVPRSSYKSDVAIRWADATLQMIRSSWPNSPTYTSRALGYIGLTMYESIVHGSVGKKSLAGQINRLNKLPLPEVGKEYNWALSLNAGQALILKSLYSHGPIGEVNQIEEEIYEAESQSIPEDVAARSVAFGRAIATAVFDWSKSDGGHEGYLRNFDFSYVVPQGEGYWTAPLVGQSASPYPLHPYWGENRTFIRANGSLPIKKMAERSTDPSSEYYKYFMEVYFKRNHLTQQEKNIAAWWADDPTQTSSPPGHSYNLATIAIKTANADIYIAAEAYAKVGMAVADSFINCWRAKYEYHSERPFPFIHSTIDTAYRQFWPEPPFPAFPSGHATQSAAAAIALISVFGEDFAIIDDTYADREVDFEGTEYKSRFFPTIWATAEECALSRFLGGIHTRQDNEAGTQQGKVIGKNVAGLDWE